MDKGSERPKPIVFKRMADGWVYRAPNPWIFGDAPHYFVTDEQKAKIQAIVVPHRPVLFGMMLVAGIVAWVFALVGLVWAVSGHEDPTTADVIAIAVLVAISLVAALPLANWIQRRRLQPILAGLPLTQERITFAEMRENSRTATPFRQSRNAFIASLFGSVGAFTAAYSHFLVSSTIDAQVLLWAFNTVVWGSVAFVWYRRALNKATETSDAASFVRFSRIVLLITVSVLVALSAGLQIYRKHLVPTARDYGIARVQFEAAAKAGDAKAMNGLGLLYQNGLGGVQDFGKATEWYAKAANAGSAAGTRNLAWLYQNGLGVPQNSAEARAVFEKAAKAGVGSSMDALGVMYINGWSVPKSEAMAREWYENAAAAGNTAGMQHLASMLDAGKGGPADPQRAAHLLLQSANLGDKWSVTVLEGPLKFLTPSTRIELKRELARLGHYSGSLDGNWDEPARAASTAYLDASHPHSPTL